MNKSWIEHCQYTGMLQYALSTVDSTQIELAYNSMIDARSFILMGNGGSAAIADHFVCDITKGIAVDSNSRVLRPAFSLSSNGPLISAIANDIGYEYVFSEQIKYMNPGDKCLVLAISSSGNSPNIVNGLKTAKEMGLKTMALVGFDGGKVKSEDLAKCCIHVKMDNYGVVEDSHHVIMHSLSQQIRNFLTPNTKLKL
jgi:D-sedoheptulose 7-phosphate isomerase